MMTARLPELTDAVRIRAMALSRLDAVVYAVMVGLGESYFLADAVRLGATAAQIALLVGLPLAIGSMGPILALRLLRTLGRRKPVVVGAAVGQAAILLLLAGLASTGRTTTSLLIVVATAYQICAQAAGTAWSSWYGDLVPAAGRGSYFAMRNRGAYAGTLVGLVVGGLILNHFEPERAGVGGAIGGGGFAIAYLLAGLARAVSAGLLIASREGPFSGMPDRARVGRFLKTERGTGVWRLVLLGGLLQLSVFIAAPFFNPYMLRTLQFTYVQYMVASACLVLVKVLVLPLWGRWIDGHGTRWTLARGGVLLALVPLGWVFVGDLWGVLLCQALSGIAWSGFEVGNFSLLLELGYRRMRPTIFAAQSVVSGCAQLAGGLVGGALLSHALDARAVFGLSSGLRLGVVLLMIRLLPRREPGTPRTRPLFRVSGFRAGTGMAQRPIEESEVPTETTDRPL
jgi:MFS family permease